MSEEYSIEEELEEVMKENKQLKDKIEKLKDYGEAVGERRNQLYDRIDKAIEYIKLASNKFEYLDTEETKELLEILEANNEQ